MASRNQLTQLKNQILVSALLLVLMCTFALPAQVYAKDIPIYIPSLSTFVETVKGGNASTLRGVYVSNVLALSVIQQPAGNPTFVSTAKLVATQFSTAAQAGNIGLLAHNFQGGGSFSKIKQGDLILLVYGDGHTESFMAQTIERYQAMDPLNPSTQFKDIETQTSFTAEKLFNKVYRGEFHLTLQTCIEKDGNLSWGRLFIQATPVASQVLAKNTNASSN